MTSKDMALPAARATHEPSPDGLGHSVGVANAAAGKVPTRLPDIEAMQHRIAEARKLRRMSLDDVAKISGMTKSHVWELEKGRSRNPTVRALWGLARALTVSPAWLLGLSTDSVTGDPIALEVAALIELRLKERV